MIDSKNAKIIATNDFMRQIIIELNSFDYNAFFLFKSILKSEYFRFQASKPRRPRTTGRRSQNNNVRGTARQIHNHCGQGIESIIEYAACKAADEGVIPFRKDENGEVIFNSWGFAMGTSESTWSTVEAAGVIKILIDMATDMGIKLKGSEND